MSLPPLLLASTSTTRKSLLQRLDIPFSCVDPAVDERAVSMNDPASLALKLSWLKAEAVAALHPGCTVIGSDQVGICNGQILHKPGTSKMAVEQLTGMSGQPCDFYTAVTVLSPGHPPLQHCDTTRVQLRTLDQNEIQRYVAREQPLFCAGSFMAEGLGISLFEGIYSEDPTALPGLPLIRLSAFLRQLGYAVP